AAFLTNGVPHFVNGVSGRPFRIPFSQGAKLGSPTANAVWGWANFLVAFLLFANDGDEHAGRHEDRIARRADIERPDIG
ncbi:hypothetical protein ACC668_37935, partial [Rhizobium ruizarguesonis]